MSESEAAARRPGIGVHYVRYFISNMLVIAAGLVSFPVLARLLDTHQFGVLGYFEAWLLIASGVLKLGAQHVILRFYPHGGDLAARLRFRTDRVLVPFALSLALWLVCAVLAVLFASRLPADERDLVWILLPIVPLMIWCSFVEAVLYALERSDVTLWLKIAWRWGELALVLCAVVAIERSAAGVFGARLAVLALVGGWLTLWFARWLRGPLAPPARAPLVAGLAFGLPMMANELTTLAFGFADRILLHALTGSYSDVGTYTIGFGLAMAVATVLGQALSQAFTPTAVRLYETAGAPAVVALKRDLLDVWLVAVATGTALLLCVGGDLLLCLAGADKAASAPVFVLLAIGFVWYSLFEVAQYGLLLQRRALRYTSITLAATVLNIVLNIPLILRAGVLGAVAATLASYAFLAAMQWWQCPRDLRYLPPMRRLLPALLYAPAMLLLLQSVGWFGATTPWTRLIAGTIAIVVPALVAAGCDRSLRVRVQRLFVARMQPVAMP